jgi:hypothetical protein
VARDDGGQKAGDGEGDGASSVRGYPGGLSTGEKQKLVPLTLAAGRIKKFAPLFESSSSPGRKSDVLTCLPGRTLPVYPAAR